MFKKILSLISLILVSSLIFAQTSKSYSLVFQDDFKGKSLNLDDWNIEFHEPGWVNNELQSYGDSKENIYVKSGKLVLQPVKKGNTYTSGRVNTQLKHSITYGKVEVRAKMPKGQGFLPAIWMMPDNEDLYGQWPKCGEIDIAEVLGHKTNTVYGTLHYGEPHSESQGKYLDGSDFSEDFHTYSVEWEPGEIRFYVDGEFFHSENDWYSKRQGFGELTYPAPFDQPFHLILNVAVGGNWPGNPDESTKFDKNAAMYIDWVKMYQLNNYDENVKKPVKKVVFRDADSTGNYIQNGDFSNGGFGEYTFLTANGGAGKAHVSNGALVIESSKAGTVDYSVQLVQPEMPMFKGSSYSLSFDMWADSPRTAIVAVTAPTVGWIRYLNDTKFNVGTSKKHYKFDFTMNDESDAHGRFEINLGNQDSTATVYITNIRLEKGAASSAAAAKCLPDGNYVLNGEFQEGEARLANWTVENNSGIAAYVTNIKNVREFFADSKSGIVNLSQELDLDKAGTYTISFVARTDNAEGELTASVAGKSFAPSLTTDNQLYTYDFSVDKAASTKLTFTFNGKTYLDNVRIVRK